MATAAGWNEQWRRMTRAKKEKGALENFLGWFSVGLGLAEAAAPGAVAGLIGLREDARNRSLLRFCGLREIASGIGILTRPHPAAWLWGRVAGDLMDLRTLQSAAREAADREKERRLGLAVLAVLGVTALDLYSGRRLSSGPAGA